MELVPLQGDDLRRAWNIVHPFAEKMAAEYGDDWPVASIAKEAADGTLLLWLVWDEEARKALGLVGTQIIIKPSGRLWLDIKLAAGEQHERWVHLIARLEEFGRLNGCERVEFRARPGWSRSLPDYQVTKVTFLSKDLNDGQSSRNGDGTDARGRLSPSGQGDEDHRAGGEHPMGAGATRH